jgi:predicted methyltransferase
MSRLAAKRLGGRRALPVLAALVAALAPGCAAAGPDDAERLLRLLDVGEGAVVADIGAGDGALAVAVARRIGPEGRVYATELEEAQRAEIRAAAQDAGVANLEVRTAEIAATGLPTACCDAVFLHHVYHHLTEPEAIGRDIARALRPGGRLAIIDFPPTWYLSPWTPGDVSKSRAGHGIEAAAVVEELSALGFEPVRTEASWSTRWIGPDPFAVVVRKSGSAVGDAVP